MRDERRRKRKTRDRKKLEVGETVDIGNKYIYCQLVGKTLKTQKWVVINKASGIAIAKIEWYFPWRQYIFESINNSFYNNGCLQAILTFMNKLNKEKVLTGIERRGNGV
jgi:hypothetical protein